MSTTGATPKHGATLPAWIPRTPKGLIALDFRRSWADAWASHHAYRGHAWRLLWHYAFKAGDGSFHGRQATYRSIAGDTGIRERTVERWTARFRADGLIETQRTWGGQGTGLTIRPSFAYSPATLDSSPATLDSSPATLDDGNLHENLHAQSGPQSRHFSVHSPATTAGIVPPVSYLEIDPTLKQQENNSINNPLSLSPPLAEGAPKRPSVPAPPPPTGAGMEPAPTAEDVGVVGVDERERDEIMDQNGAEDRGMVDGVCVQCGLPGDDPVCGNCAKELPRDLVERLRAVTTEHRKLKSEVVEVEDVEDFELKARERRAARRA